MSGMFPPNYHGYQPRFATSPNVQSSSSCPQSIAVSGAVYTRSPTVALTGWAPQSQNSPGGASGSRVVQPQASPTILYRSLLPAGSQGSSSRATPRSTAVCTQGILPARVPPFSPTGPNQQLSSGLPSSPVLRMTSVNKRDEIILDTTVPIQSNASGPCQALPAAEPKIETLVGQSHDDAAADARARLQKSCSDDEKMKSAEMRKTEVAKERMAEAESKAKDLELTLRYAMSQLAKLSQTEIENLADNDADKETFKLVARATGPEGKAKLLEQAFAQSVDRRIGEDGLKPDLEIFGESEPDNKYDIVVIGGGPAGVAGALVSASFGRRTLIVDKPKNPSLCHGTDPFFGAPTGLFSKALRDVAKNIDVKAMKAQGLYHQVIWQQLQGMCLNMATLNSEQQMARLDKLKVGYLQAHATIVEPGKLMTQRADGSQSDIIAGQILLTTGSKPFRPPEIPFDNYRVFDSDTVNGLSFLPETVVIMGSGVIAIEYAKIFCKLGAKVTMLVRSSVENSLKHIDIDRDIVKELLASLRKENVQIYEKTGVASYHVPEAKNEPLRFVLKSDAKGVPEEITADVFLAALGRKANVGGLGLEELSIKTAAKGGHILVDNDYQTNLEGIYAAGDCIGPPSLASTSVYQAKCAIIKMLGKWSDKFKVPTNFPVGMWTTPECAYYGLTKEAANAKGLHVTEGMAKYTNCLRGRVFAPEGILKIVFRTGSGRILGVHILGADACEMVHYGMDLVDQRVTIFKVISTLFTAVTYHELFKEAALDGNSKLQFGPEWQEILEELSVEGCTSMRRRTSAGGVDLEALEQGDEPSPEADEQDEHGGESGNIDPNSLRAEFNAVDSDGDGLISADELGDIFLTFGKYCGPSTLKKILNLSGGNGNGTISFDQFLLVFEIIKMSGKEDAVFDGWHRLISPCE